MIDSAPDPDVDSTKRKRDFHQPGHPQKRWYGPFESWLAKMNKVSNANSVVRTFSWSDTYTIYHAEARIFLFLFRLFLTQELFVGELS
jgi:hypothetical protein